MLSLCTIVSEPPVLVGGATGDARVALDVVLETPPSCREARINGLLSKKHVVLAFLLTS